MRCWDWPSPAPAGSIRSLAHSLAGLESRSLAATHHRTRFSEVCSESRRSNSESIPIATAATEQVGNEGLIFRFVMWHSVALGGIVGVIVMMYAYVLRAFVPHGLSFVK